MVETPLRACASRIIKLSQVASISLGLIVLSGCEVDEAPAPVPKKVKVIKVGEVSDLVDRSFPGRARAALEANLSFRVSGPLVEFPVNIGDSVKRGDLVARIDPKDFESRVEAMEGSLQQGIASNDLAEAEFKRAANIQKKNPDLISASEYDKRLGARDNTRAQVRALESSLKLAKDDLAYTNLTAPFDGVIAATYVENYENVLAKRPIARLLDSNRIEVVIDIPERLINYAPYVVSAKVTFEALAGISIDAHVEEIGNEASAVTRTYPVTLIMDQPENIQIKPGMAAKARLVSKLPEQAREVGMSIPATALFAGENAADSYVFIVNETSMTLEKRKVETSLLSATGVLVKSGLQPGEWLVVAGVHSVTEGQQVRILDATEESAP